jgi:hypothetical protein
MLNSKNNDRLLSEARRLVAYMEKLKPDSVWARRASGTRGSLLRMTARYSSEAELSPQMRRKMTELIRLANDYLHRAAKEIPGDKA